MSRFAPRRACWSLLVVAGLAPASARAQEVPPPPPPEALPPDLPPVSPIAVAPYVPRPGSPSSVPAPEAIPADGLVAAPTIASLIPEFSAARDSLRRLTSLEPPPAPKGPRPGSRRASTWYRDGSEPPPAPKAIPLAANPALDEAQTRCTAARQHLADREWAAALRATALAIRAYPIGADAYKIRAEVYGTRQLYAQAVATLDDALAACPADTTLWALRGCYRCMNRDPGGMDDLDRAQSLPLDPSGPDLATLRRWRALAAYALDDYRGCIAGFAEVAPDRIDDPQDVAYRGDAHRRLGDRERALADLEWAVIRDPSPAHRWLLGTARFQAGQFAAALVDLEAAAAAWPDHPPAQCLLGLARCAAGRRPAGLALLDRLVQDHPDAPEVQAGRGWVALLTGDLAAAHPLLNGAAGHEGGRLTVWANLAPNLWADPNADWAVAEFAARCRVAPALPWAIIWRTDAAARRCSVPGAVLSLAVISRLVPDPAVAPCLILQLNVSYEDQPWRGAAILGEFIAAAGLRDRAKLGAALGNLADFLRGHGTVADLAGRLRRGL